MTIDQYDGTRETVRDAQSGDTHAADMFVRQFERLVWWTVRSFRLPDADAEDVVQNTWLRVFEHLGEVREPDRIGSWVATIARRECLKHMRTGRREVPGLELRAEQLDDERAPHPERVAVDAQMIDLLWQHVNSLPGPAREMVVALSGKDAPAYADFARRKGIPIGSIGPTRMRSLRKLRVSLEGHGLGAHAWH
ncbi:RNA polymerase sigma factor [Amorphoplanes digitatis]|uniref:RNA polymerase sigma factor (Sigma-70 family) n=1 Tax=Actinoplanes digitatis TaxID=1868 RepID=A0A7W7MQA2_9ACTN|nr:sigma-70 family RNA polymerase sigma factor [Actinoplanes digitatis]MBB4762517.1 RNA polymerase sigma factor (sigma-70 family) [Actinoplanes digitatis]GID92357.1 RNA polymerase sigma factor [Actinoplanes digitatis]